MAFATLRESRPELLAMIDLHCHILPGVDDGPKTVHETLEMARFYVADGIDVVVATPHCHRYIHLLRAEIVPRVAELADELEKANIPLTVIPGSEIQVTDTADYRREFEEGLLCHLGDGRRFTLLEFNWSVDQFPADAAELVGWICDRRMTPIVAHPERYEFLRKDPARLHSLVEAGAWVQITVDSLLGNHGPMPHAFGKALLETYPDAVLATDAHNMSRCSGMSAGYKWIREHLGDERADDLYARAERVQQSILAPSVG